MKRTFFNSAIRMVATFAGSYAGAKLAGWVFDNVIESRS